MHIRASKKQRSEVSLNEPLGTDKDGNEISFMDIIGTDDDSIVDELDHRFQLKKLHEAVESLLTDREKTVIILRFGLYGKEPQTQNEVADLLGISRSYVKKKKKKAVSKLKTAFQEEE